ncbi:MULTISPECIES: glycerophosphoryl diester phosphodiesterase [Staphylococcus]|uniref:Glycerophosphoryl diester phosphodiesterase n=1 Tax=Staphylococcus hsinchuensis TaxID=3051183 RepID=A0ABZ3EDR3_9STAP|nr:MULTISPECIES: glycerophosphoryl diester phosphodiesterase [unclassified Staphylococcus]
MFTVYGHRGLPSKAPENTLASFHAAADIKELNWLELDVAITKDKRLLIIHDDYLDRTTDMVGEITQLNWSQMQQSSAGLWFSDEFENEKLPTFEDIIALANDKKMNLNVELKGVSGPNGPQLSEEMVRQVSEKLKQLDNSLKVLISSFNIPLVHLSKQYMSEYPRAVLFKTAAFKDDWRTIMDFCDSQIVNIEDARLTEKRVKMIKDAGYQLNVWTVNKKTRANQLKNWGVDGIFTDKADQMMQLQDEKSK